MPVDSAHRLAVAVDAPQHSGLDSVLDYTCNRPLPAGTLVRVPLGRREVAGIVWRTLDNADGSSRTRAPADGLEATERPLKPVAAVLDALPPFGPAWLQLVEFTAAYYQRSIGEVALSVLPPELRKLDPAALSRRGKRKRAEPIAPATSAPPPLNDEQHAALAAIGRDLAASTARPGALSGAVPAAAADPPAVPTSAAPAATLLHGVTGSGKTEVYLHAAAQALALGRQALVLVPEINLTPQLEARFAARFAGRTIVSLHSALTPARRLQNWQRAHLGEADLVLGTRLAIFTSLPRLGLIVVDEEHDPSYKQQEGARYSARDLAVYRGRLERVPVLLGSATPSLETWLRAEQGRYQRLTLAGRIGGGVLPAVRLVDMNLPVNKQGDAPGAPAVLSPPLLAALRERLARGEQSLVFLNRRGYAPVLHCGACAWKSGCPHCSAWRVFHKADRTLRCHHCGFSERVPRACPECGNLDIAPIGRGTEKLEEQIAHLLPDARIARIDADSTRGKGMLEAQLAEVHAGDVDVLVGTQMVAKGHDFRRMTLVAAVNPDGALFTSDFRAPERLFALLMQAGGRAGRSAEQAGRSELWVQTWHPLHPLYGALARHDFAAFAHTQLEERRHAGLPPFSALALLRAEAREAATAAAFLKDASALAATLPGADAVTRYPPVPPTLQRVADVDRMQMLLESPSRLALQHLLAAWLPLLHGLRQQHKGVLRWAVDVDPLAI